MILNEFSLGSSEHGHHKEALREYVLEESYLPHVMISIRASKCCNMDAMTEADCLVYFKVYLESLVEIREKKKHKQSLNWIDRRTMDVLLY